MVTKKGWSPGEKVLAGAVLFGTSVGAYLIYKTYAGGVKRQLIIAVSGGGTTIPAVGTHPYTESTNVIITAIPDEGYVFDHWDVDGEIFATNPLTVTVITDLTVTAYFVAGAATGLDVTFSQFDATVNGKVIEVLAKAHIVSNPASLAYASMDIYVDGVLQYGECWSDLSEVPWCHTGVMAPCDINFAKGVTVEDGTHVVKLRCYARNGDEVSLIKDSLEKTITIGGVTPPPDNIEASLQASTAVAVSGGIRVHPAITVTSNPAELEYANIGYYVDNVFRSGRCWSDLTWADEPNRPDDVNPNDPLCTNPAATAPCTLSFDETIPLDPGTYAIKFTAYARNVGGGDDSAEGNIIYVTVDGGGEPADGGGLDGKDAPVPTGLPDLPEGLYWLLVEVFGSGNIEAPMEAGYHLIPEGQTIHLNAIPLVNAAFMNWNDGANTSQNNLVEITMRQNLKLKANFGGSIQPHTALNFVKTLVTTAPGQITVALIARITTAPTFVVEYANMSFDINGEFAHGECWSDLTWADEPNRPDDVNPNDPLCGHTARGSGEEMRFEHTVTDVPAGEYAIKIRAYARSGEDIDQTIDPYSEIFHIAVAEEGGSGGFLP
jgi:hypothetical protein